MNTLISASAGSGKTYALTTEYLRLLRRGRSPGGLLAATFTRKAAGEIFDRLLARLASACLEENARTDLARALDDPSLTRDECRDLLRSLCADLHRLSIGTLDGFFGRLCGLYRQEAGLSAAARLTDPQSPRCAALRREALRALLDRLPDAEAESLLDALHQDKAASPVMEVFDGLAAELMETLADVREDAWRGPDVPPAPSSEAVNAARDALRAALPAVKDGRWRKAMEEDLRRFEAARWEEFVGGGLAAKCLDDAPAYYNRPVPAEVTSAYQTLLSVARAELLDGLRRRTEAIHDLLAVFTEEYRALRRAEGLLLFSEAPGLLGPLLDDLADAARRQDAPVEHLLLDEFQDTSDSQWGVLRTFARHAAQVPRSVFVVGDVKQAIYGWRGGRAEIFERIEAHLPDMAREARDVSYRSSPVILDAVNRVFAALATCPALGGTPGARDRWQAHFHPHRAHKALPGRVEMREIPADADPLDYAAALIAEGASRLPAGASVGVLARKNETVARLADALRALGVEVSAEGTGAVADDPAVELLLSALTLADHPGHTAAAFHVAHSPLAASLDVPPDLHARPGQAAAVANAIRRQVLVHGYAGVLADWAAHLAPYGPERTARRLEQLLDLAASWDGLPAMRPSEFVRAVRDASVETPGLASVRVMTINRAKGLEFDAVFLPELDWKAAGRPSACLVRRAPAAQVGDAVSPIAAVYAYPKEAVRRLDPALQAAYAAQQDEEITGMLCLLYVALTRARHALHLLVRPASAGPTPANILRHTLADLSESLPDGGTRLHASGDEHWHGGSSPVGPAAPPAPRPPLRFKPSDGARRRQPPPDDIPLAVADLLRLE